MFTAPAETPVTTPPATVATAALLVDQVPPTVASANVVVEPTHTLIAPKGVIAAGNGFTTTDAVLTGAAALPQLDVAVNV